MGLNLEPVPENPAKKKQIAFIVTIVAVLALGSTMFTHRWLAAGGGIDAGFGLRSMKACLDDRCESATNRELIKEHNERIKRWKEMEEREGLGARAYRRPPGEEKGPWFWLAGYLTMLAGLLSIASLVTAAVMVHKDRFVVKPIAPTSAAMIFLFLGLLGAVLFLVTNPTRGTAMQFGTGWSFWVFGLGTVAGIVAAQMLVKFKPADPETDPFAV